MNKKQVLGLSLITAIPGAGLLYFLVMAAINHGGGVFGGLMWLFWGGAAVGSAVVTVAPLLIGLFYPAAGFAAAAPAGAAAALSPSDAAPAVHETDDDEFGEPMEDDGEQLFDDEFEDDFEDDFDDDFEDDDKFKA